MKSAEDEQQKDKTNQEILVFSVYTPSELFAVTDEPKAGALQHFPFYSNTYHFQYFSSLLRPPAA